MRFGGAHGGHADSRMTAGTTRKLSLVDDETIEREILIRPPRDDPPERRVRSYLNPWRN